MAEEPGLPTVSARDAEATGGSPPPGRTRDEVALDLMKFIATQTGYGKGTAPAAGFSGKPAAHSPEEHADALLQLYERCRQALNKQALEKQTAPGATPERAT